MIIKWILITLAILLIPTSAFSQDKTGFYFNWNIDHTERYVHPSIPLSELVASKISSYFVEFDNNNKMKSVSYFFEGKPSINSNFNSFKMIREYYSDHFIEKFMNNKGVLVPNEYGVYKRVYSLGSNGFWTDKVNYNEQNQPVDEKGVARVEVKRDEHGMVISEIQFNVKGAVTKDGNGFSHIYFKYNPDGLTTYRENRNRKGDLVNGELGYATVYFQFDENGTFFEEEFRDELGNLFLHPRFDLAKINFRELNEYGKPSRIYYMDEDGYPHKERAYAKVTHRPNMTRKTITYFDRVGNITSDKNGVASSVYKYDNKGKYIGKRNYDITNKEITLK